MIICWVEKEVPEPWGLGRGKKMDIHILTALSRGNCSPTG